MPFVKAKKYAHKIRLGLAGPTGSGKTYTAEKVAAYIAAKEGGRVAVIDTEHGTAALYAEEFDFDHLVLESFAPDRYVEAIHEAEREGYAVIIVDSVTHAWAGKDGALEQVDKKAGQNGNSFTAWRDVTPQHNRLVEALVGCKTHIIVTVRSKMAYALQETEQNGRKRTVVEKLGLQPVQREGLEYEFDVFADIDVTNTLSVSKTRCKELQGYSVVKAGDELASTLWEWAQGDAAPVKTPAAPAVDRYSGFSENGVADWKAYNASLKAAGIVAEDVTRAVAPAHQDGLPRPTDYARWLELHPGQTLADMTAAIVAAKQTACEHTAAVDEATTLLTCSRCRLVLDGPPPTPAAEDAAPQPALPA